MIVLQPNETLQQSSLSLSRTHGQRDLRKAHETAHTEQTTEHDASSTHSRRIHFDILYIISPLPFFLTLATLPSTSALRPLPALALRPRALDLPLAHRLRALAARALALLFALLDLREQRLLLPEPPELALRELLAVRRVRVERCGLGERVADERVVLWVDVLGQGGEVGVEVEPF